MLKIPFNGDPIITNGYRNSKYNAHYGTDYAMPKRTAIIAPADGVVILARYWLSTDKPQNKRQWIANTESDPYKLVGFPILKRALKTEDYGNYVKLDHGEGVSTLMAHLDEPIVFEGQSVKEGELIGYSDSTGNSTGNHLHYEIRKNDRVVDPEGFDYSFKGTRGKEVKFYPYDNLVEVIVTAKAGLNVRSGGSKTSKRLKTLKCNDKIMVCGYVEGEYIDENNLWFKTSDNLFIWSGGTNLVPTDVKKGGKTMNLTEYEAKKAELESKKAAFDARQADIEARKGAFVEEEEKFASELVEFKKEQEEFAKIEQPKPEEIPAQPEVVVVEEPVKVEEVQPKEFKLEAKEEYPIEVKLTIDKINELLLSIKEYVK